MKTGDFNSNLTSEVLNEQMYKTFGKRVNLEKYNREQLENYRNVLRTKVHQLENTSGFNELLANESYQENKHLLELLNTRIKEMLGEAAKKKMVKEKAVSKKQQQAAGIALAAKRKGKKPKGKGAASQMAKMSTKELEKFAGTKHKGLPVKKKKKKTKVKENDNNVVRGLGSKRGFDTSNIPLRRDSNELNTLDQMHAYNLGKPRGNQGTNVVPFKKGETVQGETTQHSPLKRRGNNSPVPRPQSSGRSLQSVGDKTKVKKIKEGFPNSFSKNPKINLGKFYNLVLTKLTNDQDKKDAKMLLAWAEPFYSNNLTYEELESALYSNIKSSMLYNRLDKTSLVNVLDAVKTVYKDLTDKEFNYFSESFERKDLPESKKYKTPPVKGKMKKARKDWDGDGKIESPKDEVWGSRAKAAAKAGKPFGKKKLKETYRGVGMPDPNREAEERAEIRAAQKELQRLSQDKRVRDWINSTPFGLLGLLGNNPLLLAMRAMFSPGWDRDQEAHYQRTRRTANQPTGRTKKGMTVKENSVPKSPYQRKLKENQLRNDFKMILEGIRHYIAEDEEGKAMDITAGADMVKDFTSWMQRLGQYQTKSTIELADSIRSNFGPQEADQFKATVTPAIVSALEALTASREIITKAVSVLAGEEQPDEMMGEPSGEDEETPSFEPDSDSMNQPPEEEGGEEEGGEEEGGEETADQFAASDAASAGRELRESRIQYKLRKLHEANSIMRRLAG